MRLFVIFFSTFMLLCPWLDAESQAESYYTWRDAEGKLHITNHLTGSIQDKDELEVYHYSQEKTELRGTSDVYQRRIYQQMDSNIGRYVSPAFATNEELERQKQDAKRFRKSVEVEKKMLRERIHYYKFRCATVRSAPGRKRSCDAKQKLYEKKLELLQNDPEEYFIRELR
ncbi:MAG: DUF4124 domain-containing protein [Desulfuromonadaceae bacterium]|nr:DUF4124 domain-containing protein [Desulfuromonadaceae bacterium]